MTNVVRMPFQNAVSLLFIDMQEMRMGYATAIKAEPDPEPDMSYSYSYWHGWRMGMIESRKMPRDKYYDNLTESIKYLLANKTLAR